MDLEKFKNLLELFQDKSDSSLDDLLKEYFPPDTSSPANKVLVVFIALAQRFFKIIKWVALITL